MYSEVPKKHHLNCGFSVVSYHSHTQEEQTFHLLAETPEDMKYWVHELRCVDIVWGGRACMHGLRCVVGACMDCGVWMWGRVHGLGGVLGGGGS